MEQEKLVLGKRYQLNHGTGVLIGYEAFDKKGMSADMTMTPQRSDARAIFKLDEGHTWAFPNAVNYYSSANEVQEYVAV